MSEKGGYGIREINYKLALIYELMNVPYPPFSLTLPPPWKVYVWQVAQSANIM